MSSCSSANDPVWPNSPTWSALKHERTVESADGPTFLWVVPCGDLLVPSGRLVVCDPFAFLAARGNPQVLVPRGQFPVLVTLADVSPAQDRSHVREAYASIIFSRTQETYRRPLPLIRPGEAPPQLQAGEFVGFGVDAGTACFVDDSVIGPCMPNPKTWYDDVFNNQRPDCWFRRMDDPNHIREGIANIVLPLAHNGENLVLFHSGWGDGVYPVVGSFGCDGHLVAAHVDLFVVK